jgi:ribulose-5-phosphate 4-epimerase/fuculose-1-phosphate aldolase
MVTGADSLGNAVALAVYLEKSCQLQLMVGRRGHVVSDDDVLEKRSGQLARPSISWAYLKRVNSIEEIGPSDREDIFHR